jgi:uncharacterized protein (TIGR02246 family)
MSIAAVPISAEMFHVEKRGLLMRQPKYLWIPAILAMVGVVAGPMRAEDAVNSASDERAVRAASKEYLAAKKRGNLELLRKMWTPNGDYVNASGQAFKVWELFRGQVENLSPDLEPTVNAVPESSLRFITPDVAIEDGATKSGTLPDGSTFIGRFTAVWVNQDGRWLLDSLREATAATPQFNDQLRPLEWLLGEWVGTTDHAAILLTSHWSDDGKYIIREFLVRSEDREDITATQRIGWDASTGTIRCWTFDSLGGSGEGIWKRDGERWLVDSTEVLADGKKSKTSAVYVSIADGQFVSEVKAAWDSVDKQETGANPPTLRVEFKRAVED